MTHQDQEWWSSRQTHLQFGLNQYKRVITYHTAIIFIYPQGQYMSLCGEIN